MTSLRLPIEDVLPELLDALRGSSSIVLRAPTGAGKTTRVPIAMLDAGLCDGKQIILLQPRRIAARAAAARMAEERGTRLGAEIGYQFRFERVATEFTRILCVTDGLLIRMLQDDPLLERVGAIIFDEFHERSLNSDLGLAMVRRVQQEVRPELRIVVMSATLAPQPISQYLGGCSVIESEGFSHPVDVRYSPFAVSSDETEAVVNAVRQLLVKTHGDTLVFCAGMAEIRRIEAAVQPIARRYNSVVHVLHGDLPIEQQHAVLNRGGPQKIVLATNVAETSVTIPGITAVVDTGKARVLRNDPGTGLNRLEVQRISRAAADQRAGRAGRTAPGICIRLWTEREHRGLAEFEVPEVARLDLAEPMLELLRWGERDLQAFPWFETPPATAIEQAGALLKDLGAIDQRGLTKLGHEMAKLPVHPRLARLLLEARRLGCIQRAALAAAILGERDPFLRGRASSRSRSQSESDVLDRVYALESFEQSCGRTSDGLHVGTARNILRARDQLLRLVRSSGCIPDQISRESDDEQLCRALLAGFSDRLARRREPGSKAALMVGGRGVRMHPGSAVAGAELFVCVDVEAGTGAEGVVRIASAVDASWLPQEDLKSAVETVYDPQRDRIVAFRRTKFRGLVLDEATTSIPAGEDTAVLLAQEAVRRGELLSYLDDECKLLVARIEFLREWMNELEFPKIDEVFLQGLLQAWCAGCLSLAQLRKQSPVHLIRGSLSGPQLTALDREAPERILVPSGNRVSLIYQIGQRPVLPVRIQEVFGMHRTPRLAGGRVAVLLHLLAPNMRPQQITDDLESFWKSTYTQVRKDLRRRYPKHAWPENPLEGVAESRPGAGRKR